MRILLIAYEYPPVVAAQSLRWFYLANELAAGGMEVEVLTTRIRDIWGFRGRIEAGITVHRCFPGPFIGFSSWLAGRLSKEQSSSAAPAALSRNGRPMTAALDWLYGAFRCLLNHVLFPDVRTEWLPFAWSTLKRLCSSHRYDLLLSSHEPGIDLILGLLAKKKWGIPWIVDIGDPVLTPYTPAWRARLDRRFERTVCAKADHILVTTDSTIDLLTSRHGISRERFTVIPQGFSSTNRTLAIKPERNHKDHAVKDAPSENWFTLVYTGTFYRDFRNPSELLAALAILPGVHLIIAGDIGNFEQQLEPLGDRVDLLGKVDHSICLELQKKATLLVNIGNKQAYQIPGKLFEYFGAARPILHISVTDVDPGAKLVKSLRRGIVVQNHRKEIQEALTNAYSLWQRGVLDQAFDLSLDRVSDYSWAAAAARVQSVFEAVYSAKRIH